MPVGDLLEWLDRRLASGSLTLVRGTTIRKFQVESGRVTLAYSTEQKHMLGRLLIDRGLVSEPDLERALRAGQETGTRLGRVLTLVGAVPEETVRDLLRQKIQNLVAEALAWTDGRFVFEDGPGPKGRPLVPVTLRIRDALKAARAAPADLAVAPH
jgi:hypothetical protein